MEFECSVHNDRFVQLKSSWSKSTNSKLGITNLFSNKTSKLYIIQKVKHFSSGKGEKRSQPTGGSYLSQRKGLFIIHQPDGDNHWASSFLYLSGSYYHISIYLDFLGCWNMCLWQPLPCGSSPITCISALGSFGFLWSVVCIVQRGKVESQLVSSSQHTATAILLRCRQWVAMCPFGTQSSQRDLCAPGMPFETKIRFHKMPSPCYGKRRSQGGLWASDLSSEHFGKCQRIESMPRRGSIILTGCFERWLHFSRHSPRAKNICPE